MNIDRFKGFIEEELSELTEKVTAYYQKNMAARAINVFLAFENSGIQKFMALGRSIDSQLGTRMQHIIFYLCREKYGYRCVPNIVIIETNESNCKVRVTGYYVDAEIDRNVYLKSNNPCTQMVYINPNLKFDDAVEKIHIKKKNRDLVKVFVYEYDNVADADIKFLNGLGTVKFPVDLLLVLSKRKVETFEIKLSGKLDTKNAKSNADEVERLKKMFGFTAENVSFFASCYGECSEAVMRAMKAYAAEGKILSGKDLWERVLPEDMSYESFIDTYRQSFKESRLEEKIAALS